MARVVRWAGRRVAVAVLGLFAACGGNAPPYVEASNVLVLQGVPEALTLSTGDPDGDAMTFTVIPRPGRALGEC